MIARWKDGFDIVNAVRRDSEGVGIFKRFTSFAYYRFFNWIDDNRLIAGASDFRLLDRKVVDVLNQFRERTRFVRGLVAWVGFRQTALPYSVGARYAGKTKYSVRRMLRFARDGITSFSTLPLRVSAYLGLLAVLAGVLCAVWVAYTWMFADQAVSGSAAVFVATLLLGGIQLLCLGVLGEYLGKMYEDVKGRPLYITRELAGFDEPLLATDRSGREESQDAAVLDSPKTQVCSQALAPRLAP